VSHLIWSGRGDGGISSRFFRLEPGDVSSRGRPRGRRVKAGDTMKVGVESSG